jgi:hydroxymethylbilane synthase
VTIRLATRGSVLARWQAEYVASLLAADADAELVIVQTTGDVRTDVPLHEIGGQGVFVKEVQQAVLDGRADVAVHSAKDLPSRPTDGLVIAAVPERGSPWDALVGESLITLAPGATVATGSVRRQAQLAALRPDLEFVDLRGNVPTRLTKVPLHGAVVVAMAALERLGLGTQVAEVLGVDVMIPQVGQGALAVECRAADTATRALLAGLEHGPSRLAVDVERTFLAELGGGCELPAGAYAEVDGPAVTLYTFLADGPAATRHTRMVERGPTADARTWAAAVARRALAAVSL